jgi:hypothetical protein
MTARNEAAFFVGTRAELNGPDLAELGPWADYAQLLDTVKASGDLDAYVETWIHISDAHGGSAQHHWDNDDAADAPGHTISGYGCDAYEAERRVRWNAMHDHHADASGFREKLARELVRRGRFNDNRRATSREIIAVVRAFVATGGELLIDPNPLTERCRIDAKPETNRFVKGDWSEADTVAARAMFRLLQRWRAKPVIERLVRALGATTANNWIVLSRIGAEGAPEKTA